MNRLDGWIRPLGGRHMKHLSTFIVTVFLASGAFAPKAIAGNSTDLGLPEGALVRLGKEQVSREGYDKASVALSPDGSLLAMATPTGVRLYDTHTGGEVGYLLGHARAVASVAFSPDGATLASGSTIGESHIRLWDIAEQREKSVLRGHSGIVTTLAFSPDGKTLASASSNSMDYSTWLWDVTAGKLKSRLPGHGNYLGSVAFSPDGRMLATASSEFLRMWDVADGTLISKSMQSSEFISHVAFSPDGASVASAGFGSARLWDARTGRLLTSYRTRGETPAVYFSPDGASLWTINGHAIDLWDAVSGQLEASFSGHADWVQAISLPDDGAMLASGSRDGTVRLWDVLAREQRLTLKGHRRKVSWVSLSRDGEVVASLGITKDGHEVRLWNAKNGELIAVLGGGSRIINSVGHGPSPGTLISGGNSGIRVWNLHAATMPDRSAQVADSFPPHVEILNSTSQESETAWDTALRWWEKAKAMAQDFRQGSIDKINAVSMSPDGTLLASGDERGIVRVWEFPAGRSKAILEGHAGSVLSLSFAPDTVLLASGGEDGVVRFWDIGKEQMVAAVEGHAGPVSAVEFSADGATLASGGEDGVVRLWDVATFRQIKSFEGRRRPDSQAYGNRSYTRSSNTSVLSLSWSPDGETLASGSEDWVVRVWDVETGTPRAFLERHMGPVTSVSFAPDGATLASSSGDSRMTLAGQQRDNTVRLWDTDTWAEKAVLRGHTGGVTSLSFAPDGGTLASGSEDGSILVWETGRYNTPAVKGHWCGPAQSLRVNFRLTENGKTVSICREEPNTLVYFFGELGSEPELEYKGPILDTIRARAVLWGEGVKNLSELATAVAGGSGMWHAPEIDPARIARAASSRESSGFYVVEASTGLVSQSVHVFRSGGWEYTISSSSGRPMNDPDGDVGEYRSNEITVVSPQGRTYVLR